MPSGGSRNRSGPAPDPGSLRSARRDFQAVALPREGYLGPVPAFPLPGETERELAVWDEVWRTPQAAAWAQEPWRHRTIAQYVRWSVRSESRDAPASVGVQAIRLGDQIGLTPAGLRENGWTISRDEVAAAREEAAASPAPPRRPARTSARDRLTVVDDAAGG